MIKLALFFLLISKTYATVTAKAFLFNMKNVDGKFTQGFLSTTSFNCHLRYQTQSSGCGKPTALTCLFGEGTLMAKEKEVFSFAQGKAELGLDQPEGKILVSFSTSSSDILNIVVKQNGYKLNLQTVCYADENKFGLQLASTEDAVNQILFTDHGIDAQIIH